MNIVFRYGEIALKQGNRGFYERILRQNIANSLKVNCNIVVKVYYKKDLGVIEGSEHGILDNLLCIFNVLAVTPGIAWFGINVLQLPVDIFKQSSFGGSIFKPIKWILEVYLKTLGKQLEINVKRKNKSLGFTSQDIWIALRKLQHKLEKDSNLSDSSDSVKTDLVKEVPQKIKQIINNNISKLHSIQLIIEEDVVNVYARFNGVFGLPVSATGRGIVLFSGGIDSPVAAFVTAKRGISFDLLHFSPYSADEIKQTKIYEIYKKLKLINPYARLFVAGVPFLKQIKTNLDAITNLYNPMIIFKRIIAKAACLLGIKLYKNEFVVISGDSLGQVSSQTISNLVAVNKAFYDTKIQLNHKGKDKNNESAESTCLNHALFIRPLSGMNKDEIINIAKQIGTYDLSIKKYVDCCSILARTSKTRTNLRKIQEQDINLNMQEIIGQVMKTVTKVE